jgi:hypothetical protein
MSKKRESASFVIQMLSSPACSTRKTGTIWNDITNPEIEGEDFSSTVACESWIKKNLDRFGGSEPTLRIVQVKRCVKMEVQVKKTVTFEDQHLPLITSQEEHDGEEAN